MAATLLLTPLLLTPPAHAQDAATAALDVHLRDRSGAVIAGAAIAAIDGDGIALSAPTDAQGELLLPHLRPGLYRLTVSAQGFAPLASGVVQLELGHTARLELQLEPASVRQQVEVPSSDLLRPSLADSPANANLSPEELQLLPIDGRRFQDYAVLTPLVNAVEPAGAADAASVADADTRLTEEAADTAETSALSVRGLDPSLNRFVIDGSGATRGYDGAPRGGQRVPFTLPLSAVASFQVRALGAGSTLGEDAGGAIQAITRTGSDRLHASAFLVLRNSAAAATSAQAVRTVYNGGSPLSSFVKPREQREQFGGAVGGPLPRTHQQLRYFAAAEWQRHSFPAIASPANPLFFSLTDVQTALLQNRGVTLPAIARGLAFLDSLGGEVPRHANEFALEGRLDWQRGARDLVTLQGSLLRYDAPAAAHTQPVVARSRSSLGNVRTDADSLTLRWTHALSSRWLAGVAADVSHDRDTEQAQAPLPQEPHTTPAGGAPEVDIAGEFLFGSALPASRRLLPDERRLQLDAEASFNGRAHTITVGLSSALLDARSQTAAANNNGAYLYESGYTRGRAGGLVDFLTDYTFSALSYPNGGCPSIFAAVHLFCYRSYTQSFGTAGAHFHTAEWTAYAGDGWRLTPHLRAEAGVRYEYQRLPPPLHPNPQLDIVFGSFASTTSIPADTNNLAPHAAVAWAPARDGRTVLRVSYGVHFARVSGRVLETALTGTAQPLSAYRFRLTPAVEVAASCASAGTNFGYPASYICQPSAGAATTGSAVVFARGFQSPMVQQAELSVEHAWRRGVSLSATYALTLERQLPNSTDLNIAPSTQQGSFRITRLASGGSGAHTPGVRDGDIFRVPLYTARVDSSFGPVTALLSNGSGTDHALVLQAEHRPAGGQLEWRTAWTYAKALSFTGMGASAVRQDAQFDPFDVRYDRAASDFDRRHKITITAVWQPRAPELHSGIATRLLRDWSLASLLFATSGRPYSYLISGGTALPGGRQSINGSGGAAYLPTVGRNTLRLPWTSTVDLRLSRTVPLERAGRSCRLGLYVEAFNLLNRNNLPAVEQRAFVPGAADATGTVPLVFQDAPSIAAEGLNQRPFGTPLAAQTNLNRERRLQAGLRLSW